MDSTNQNSLNSLLLSKTVDIIFKTSNSVVNRLNSNPILKETDPFGDSRSDIPPTILGKLLTLLTGKEVDSVDNSTGDILAFLESNELSIDILPDTFIDLIKEHITINDDNVIVDQSTEVVKDIVDRLTSSLMDSFNNLLNNGTISVRNIFNEFKDSVNEIPYIDPVGAFDVKMISIPSIIESDVISSFNSTIQKVAGRVLTTDFDKSFINIPDGAELMDYIGSGEAQVDNFFKSVIESGALSTKDAFHSILHNLERTDSEIQHGQQSVWETSTLVPFFYEPIINALFFNNLANREGIVPDQRVICIALRNYWQNLLNSRIGIFNEDTNKGKLVFKAACSKNVCSPIDQFDVNNVSKTLVINKGVLNSLSQGTKVNVNTIKSFILKYGDLNNCTIETLEKECDILNKSWETTLNKAKYDRTKRVETIVKSKLSSIACSEAVRLYKAGIVSEEATKDITRDINAFISKLQYEGDRPLLDICVDIVYGVMYGKQDIADIIKLNFDETLEIDIALVREMVNGYLINFATNLFVIK